MMRPASKPPKIPVLTLLKRLNAQQYDNLKVFLERFEAKRDLEEVVAAASQEIDKSARDAAYLYLAAEAPLTTLSKLSTTTNFSLGSVATTIVLIAICRGRQNLLGWLIEEQGLSLNFDERFVYGPVMHAIGTGQQAMLDVLLKPKDKGGYGLHFDLRKNYVEVPVLLAVWNNQPAMLAHLLKPHHQGGYGLTLNVRDGYGRSAVFYAAARGAQDILAQLVKPRSQGGYGLDINDMTPHGEGAVYAAISHNQVAMLTQLVKPQNQGGYGLRLGISDGPIEWAINSAQLPMLKFLIQDYGMSLHIYHHLNLAKQNKKNDIFEWIFIQGFNQKLTQSIPEALAWAKTCCNNFANEKAALTQLLMDRYKELIKYLLNVECDDQDIRLVIEAIEEYNTGEGRIFLAGQYEQDRNYVAAFQNYLSVFEDVTCSLEKRRIAGFYLANLILKGDVVLVEGVLDLAQTEAREEASVEQRNQEGANLAVMTQRALYAYEYLHGNATDQAAALRGRFDTILSGTIHVSLQEKTWTLNSLREYLSYYSKKNPLMLTDINFINAFKESTIKIEIENKRLQDKISGAVVSSSVSTMFGRQEEPGQIARAPKL